MAWGHHYFSMAAVVAFYAAIWSTSWTLFQSYKSYSDMQLEKGLGKFEYLGLAL